MSNRFSCARCRVPQPRNCFTNDRSSARGFKYRCKTCVQQTRQPASRASKRRQYIQDRAAHLNRILITSARARAAKRGTVCTIIPKDVVVPAKCPVFGFTLLAGTGRMLVTSPTLDEIVPGKGYVAGNVQVISAKANVMKSNATPEELRQFARWVRKVYGE